MRGGFVVTLLGWLSPARGSRVSVYSCGVPRPRVSKNCVGGFPAWPATQPVKWTFTVKAGEEYVEKRALAKGKLACDADPWAEVFIGKRRLGTTPLAPISLTEGTYTLRLVNPDLKKEKIVTARVKPGQVTRLKEKL